ncbi:hypothetical protein SLS60_002791 [Paraconiothyrium brasiliense]|uniref:Glycoside hydrolase/deacetylase n=1 Tax=Paraconiothyrium brasiliense TaxID=300254 RepID=A0ABR3RTT7_9PLEO
MLEASALIVFQGWCGNTPEYCNAPDCLINYGPGCDANKVPNGDDTRTIARPQLGNVDYGNGGLYSCTEPGTVAITYDDGPYIYTDYVLDLFEKYNMKATFFITGINNGKGAIDDASTQWPAVISKMYAAGHQVASHTWSHQDLSAITQEQRINQMVHNEMAIRNIIQKFPTYMRPPYSSCDEASGCWKDLQDLGYVVTYFDIDTDDYDNDSPDKIQNAKNNFNKYFQTDNVATDKFLSIEHDIHEQTAHNLTEYMLQIIQEKGYKGVTVGECLGDPAENWYRSSSGKIVTSSSSVPTATSSAVPTATPTKVSTDGTCGGNTGSTCQGSEFGNCCSQAGWCGTSDAYCGTGCNALFGTCAGSSAVSSAVVSTSAVADAVSSTPVVASSASAPAASATGVTGKQTTDGTCGSTSGFNCIGWSEGECCSTYGWCGNTADHCGTACNPLYGKCTSSSTPATTIATSIRATSTSASAPAKTSAASNVSTNGKCGARNGNKVCPGSKCCSVMGNCGDNLLYCWAGCQQAFGQCW